MRQNEYVILVPCYNEEQNIEKFVSEVESLSIKNNLICDICFVDDGSTDNSWEIINKICKQKKNIKAILLSKNFGKENAIEAGLESLDYNNYIIVCMQFYQSESSNTNAKICHFFCVFGFNQ